MSPIQISIKDYRAVKSAEIAMNGITLISGINSSGKSSISRLLYYAFKYANDYESMANSSAILELRPIDRLVHNSTMEFRRNEFLGEMRHYYRLAEESSSLDLKVNSYCVALELFKEFIAKNENNRDSINESAFARFRSIIDVSILGKRSGKNTSLSELIDDVIKKTRGIKEKADSIASARGYALYKKNLAGILEDDIKNVRITEYGVPFVGKDVTNTFKQNYPLMPINSFNPSHIPSKVRNIFLISNIF